jgi:hypothetical protein
MIVLTYQHETVWINCRDHVDRATFENSHLFPGAKTSYRRTLGGLSADATERSIQLLHSPTPMIWSPVILIAAVYACHSQLSAPPFWYSMTRVSKKSRRSIAMEPFY